jgi:phage terminase small subunit
MRTGRPPKTAEQKALAGTLQKCRPNKEVANFTPLRNVPDVPKWLESDLKAADLWKRLAPLLIADNVLAEKDLVTLANLCLVQSRIMNSVVDPEAFSSGLHAAYAKYGAALGLAHGWRSRVPASEKEPEQNPFEAFKGRAN